MAITHRDATADDLDFAEKPIRTEATRHLGPEHFDGNLAPMPAIVGKEDCCHPAPADLPLNCIDVGE
jgi:hypothetical protein